MTDIIDFSKLQQTYFNTIFLVRACEPHFDILNPSCLHHLVSEM